MADRSSKICSLECYHLQRVLAVSYVQELVQYLHVHGVAGVIAVHRPSPAYMGRGVRTEVMLRAAAFSGISYVSDY